MTKLQLDRPDRPWLPIGLLVALALLIYSPVIFGGQFFWDDYLLMVNNGPVHDPHGLYRIWFTTENPDYFPLTSTLFWMEWRLFGNTPADSAFNPYHLVNALLHAGAGIFLWQTLKQLRVRGALLAALLFVAHPVNVESVAWIAEAKNALSVFMMLAAALLWIRSERSGDRWLYAASIGLFLLALLAKTAVVMLPVALVAALWYRQRATPAALLRTVPYFLLSLGLGLVTMWFQSHRSIQDAVVRNDGFLSRLATAGCALWFYLAKACFPVWMSFSYARWDISKAPGALDFVPLVLMAALLATLWLLRGRIGRGYVAALAAYVAMLLPVLGFVNIFFMRYSLVSDHWQYPALPAFCAAAASTVVWFLRPAKSTSRAFGPRQISHTISDENGRTPRSLALPPGESSAITQPSMEVDSVVSHEGGKLPMTSYGIWNVGMCLSLAVIGLLAADSASIAAVYRTPESVWTDLVHHDETSWLAHERLGAMLLERSRSDPSLIPQAMEHLQRVVDLRPDLVVGYTNLGNAYMAIGQIDEARRLYQKGVAAPDGDRRERAIAHVNLGLLARRTGDAAGAEREFEQAVRTNPESTYSWLNLGISRLARNDVAGARAAFEKSVAVDETFVEPRLRLADAALRMGDQRTAQEQADHALELEPDNQMALALEELLHRGGALPATTRAASAPATLPEPATRP